MSDSEREEIIERLVEDRFGDWVWSRNYQDLESALRLGFKGFEQYTDDELKEANDDVLPENVEVLQHQKTAHGN